MSIGHHKMFVLQTAAASALGLICLGVLVHALFVSEAVPFIRKADGATWIAAPMPFTSNLVPVLPHAPPVHTFVRRFSVDGDVGRAMLHARGLRRMNIVLNGNAIVDPTAEASWRQETRVDVGRFLQRGRNELRVGVSNMHGPPLLQLRLELEGRRIETDTSWQVVTPRANPKPAVVASDRLFHPESLALPEPGQILAERALGIALLFGLAVGGSLALGRTLTAGQRRRLPDVALGIITLFWALLFGFKLSGLTVLVGFDVPAHLVYIDYILEHHALPLARDGFSSYHPPVFHLLTSLLVALFDVSRESVAGRLVYRSISFAAGLGSVWMTASVARRLWPSQTLRPTLAVATAGLLPMNIYISSYVSNESLNAAWVSLSLLLAVRLLLSDRLELRRVAPLCVALGLALLTKFTSLLIAPLIAFFVASRAWLLDDEGPGRTLGWLGTLLGGAALISGWYYVRNWIAYGDPVVWNLNVPGEATWWMLPGFHTADYYTHFGEAMRHPFFAGFSSFWDGVYSTLWGDGLVGGMILISTRHTQWNYDLMTLGYWLAFPATLLMLLGFGRLVREAVTHPDLGRRLAFSMLGTVLFLLAFSLLRITLSLPFYAQAKAFYMLAAVLPLSIAAAEGLAWLPERLAGPQHSVTRAVYYGYLGTLAGVIVASFLL